MAGDAQLPVMLPISTISDWDIMKSDLQQPSPSASQVNSAPTARPSSSSICYLEDLLRANFHATSPVLRQLVLV